MNESEIFDFEMLGITEDQIKEVDASESEVVSRILTPRNKDITATIKPDGIFFNTTSIRCMKDVVFIQMYMDRKKQLLYVVPVEEYDKDSHRWCGIKGDKRISRKMTSRDFGDRAYSMMGWSKGYSYQVTGYSARQIGTEDEYMLTFDLKEFARTLLTEKGLAAAGVDDMDLGEEASKIHAEIAKESERKAKAKEEAKATGKRVRGKKKKEYFGAVQDGAFGVLKKDHVNRIEPRPLSELERISATGGGKDSDEPVGQPIEGSQSTPAVSPVPPASPSSGFPGISLEPESGLELVSSLEPGSSLEPESGSEKRNDVTANDHTYDSHTASY